MKLIGRTFLFGFLLWLTVFASAVLIFPIKQSDPLFFETLITIFMSGFTVLFGHLYLGKVEATLSICVTTGFTWAFINILIDLPLFMYGPMKRGLADYMTDIGLTYLVIPIIMSAFALNKKKV